MKRTGWLKDKVLDVGNVYAAMEEFNRHRPRYRRIEPSIGRAKSILDGMSSGFADVVGRPRKKMIHEAGKWRELEIPSYESCIAQIALWRICGQYVEKRIHGSSFSSRVGMGGRLAREKLRRFVRTNAGGRARYFLYFDIRQFYRHIDKRVLMDRIARVFKDPWIVGAFRDVVYSTDAGLPIGYPFSHALANLYLVPLYHLAFSIGGRNAPTRIFVYMDNWTVFARSKKTLHAVRKAAAAWLVGVGCHMKDDWQIAPTASRYVHVCGFREGVRASMLYRGIWHRIMRNVDKLSANPGDERLRRSLMSRLGWLKAINRHNSKPLEGVRKLWK